MDVREKLVEMSEQLRYCADVSDCANCKRWDKVCENQCVDNLLLMAADLIDEVANGVTVQEWISVKDRLPTFYDADADNCVLAIHKASNKRYYHWRSVADNPFDFTYWMKTPQPPKGD